MVAYALARAGCCVAADEVAVLPMTVEFGVRDEKPFVRPLSGRR